MERASFDKGAYEKRCCLFLASQMGVIPATYEMMGLEYLFTVYDRLTRRCFVLHCVCGDVQVQVLGQGAQRPCV